MADMPETGTAQESSVETRDLLRAGLAQLSHAQRSVLVLRFVCDMSIEDVATALRCSAGTVKSHTSRGLAALRQALGVQREAPVETFHSNGLHHRPLLLGPSGRSAIDAGDYSYPAAANISGIVVGSTLDGPHAWVYRDGHLQQLAPLPGYDRSAATGINARGDIVGTVSSQDSPTVAVMWSAGSTTPRRLATDWAATAMGITDDGTIIGKVFPGVDPKSGRPRDSHPNEGQPYVWAPDGTGWALDVPAGLAAGHAAAVHGGHAVGFAFLEPPTDSDPTQIPARWDLDTGKITTLRSVEAKHMRMTASGWITFGTTIVSPELDRALRVPVPQGADPDFPTYIDWVSEDGRTVIGTTSYPDRFVSTVWSCE